MGYFMSKIMLDFTWLLGRLRRIYFMALPENEGDYEKSRKNFIAGDSANQTIAQLAGGTFLVSLMLSVHIPDASIGVITSMGSLAAVSYTHLDPDCSNNGLRMRIPRLHL